MRVGKLLLAGAVAGGAVAGCGRVLGAEWGEPDTAPAVSETASVLLYWTPEGSLDPRQRYTEYEATVTLHEPAPGGGVCGAETADGTGTARVTIELTSRTEDIADADLIPEHEPGYLAVTPLDASGSLRWADERWGRGTCVEGADLIQAVEDRGGVFHGELAGVPLEDPSGHGVRVEFVAPDWKLGSHEAEPLSVGF